MHIDEITDHKSKGAAHPDNLADIQKSIKLSKVSIHHATADQHAQRIIALAAVRYANIKYVKMYSNMSGGKLRVKLFGVYRENQHSLSVALTVQQQEALIAAGFARLDTGYGAQSYSMYID